MKLSAGTYLMRTVSLAFFALALCPAASRAADTAAGLPRPNFVVILIDDMGYGDIGPFGSKLNRTPCLDRMAAEGMKLTSFYAAPVCTPSRAQMMTGCYAKRVSLPNVLGPVSRVGISSSERTVAELLKQQGYVTMCVGKWHLGDQPEFLPTRHGFDHYLGLPYSNDMGGAGKPGSRRPPVPLMRDQRVIEAPAQQEKLVERYTEEAVKFITANKDRPFFLYLPHTAVHVPIHPG
jgi:arylsulfatase A